jgi:NAD(P)-dependent dehydrogenase (short-subunit alcohol dehydrogenase family)
MGEAEDIARVASFLASQNSDYMTGQSLNVCGGLGMN